MTTFCRSASFLRPKKLNRTLFYYDGACFAWTDKFLLYTAMHEKISPSDVVSLIDNVFPGIAGLSIEQTAKFRVTSDWLPQLSAILHLVDCVSKNLLPKSARVEIAVTVAAIRAVVISWMLGNHDRYLEYLPGLGARHPIAILRQALLNSSDRHSDITEFKRCRLTSL